MADIHENKLLYRSLQVSYGILAVCTLELFPPLNDLLQLTAMPSTSEATGDSSGFLLNSEDPLYKVLVSVELPVFLCGVMVIDTFLVFAAERAIRSHFEGAA